MRRILLAVTALFGCKEPNPAFVADDTGTTSSATSTTSSSSLSADSSASITGASVTSSEESSTTAPATASQTDTQDPDTTSATSAAATSSESTGATSDDPYPACDLRAAPPCPRGLECLAVDDFNWCSQPCDGEEDCPAPATGDPAVVCAGPDGNQCALDCSDSQTCPDGMSCVEIVNNIFRCVWPA